MKEKQCPLFVQHFRDSIQVKKKEKFTWLWLCERETEREGSYTYLVYACVFTETERINDMMMKHYNEDIA